MTAHRRQRGFGLRLHPAQLDEARAEGQWWHETDAEMAAGLFWGARRAVLLDWVRRRMRTRLDEAARRCVERYYFEGMSCRAVAARTGMSRSAVHRALRRGVRLLRAAAEAEGVTWERGGRPRRR